MNEKDPSGGQLKCPLCGFRFSPEDNMGCNACPAGRKCGMICCPHCGYGFVERSRVLDFVKRLLQRRRGDETSASGQS